MAQEAAANAKAAAEAAASTEAERVRTEAAAEQSVKDAKDHVDGAAGGVHDGARRKDETYAQMVARVGKMHDAMQAASSVQAPQVEQPTTKHIEAGAEKPKAQPNDTDDEAERANSNTPVEPTSRKTNPVATPQKQDMDTDSVAQRKRASEETINGKPTTTVEARKKLNLGGGAAGSATKA